MLLRPNRLRSRSDIRLVYRDGRRLRLPLAMLIVHANMLDDSRFAIAAGRRVGGAVVRNRAKRRVSEIVRLHLTEIDVGWDCLFVLHAPAASASYHGLEEAVMELLRRAGLLCDTA